MSAVRGSDPAALSSARLGEVLAHVTFYSPEPLARILDALGYAPEVQAEVAEARGRLHWALDAGLAVGGAEELRAFVTAYDVVFRRLRARRPKLSSAAIDPRLEPVPAAPAPKHAGWVALPAAPAAPPKPAAAVPSYLQTPERLDTGSPLPAEPRPAPASDPNETMMTDGRQIIEGLKLPFVDPKLAPAFVPPTTSTPAASGNPDGETLLAPMDPEVRAALPFAAKLPTDLETYVRLTVALASDENRGTVLARFGLTETSRERFSRDWAERIAKDPKLAERYASLLRELRR